MRSAFTLIELALITAVLSILLVMGLSIYGKNFSGEARVTKTQEMLDRIGKALDMFYSDCGGYPSSFQELWKNTGITGWYGPYIDAPSGNVNLTQIPKTPIGEGAVLNCSGEQVYVDFKNVHPADCDLLDKKADDGNPNTGRVRRVGSDCRYYFVFSSAICK